MCDFLSGYINLHTLKIVSADLRSHSNTARILKLDLGDKQRWREWEWTSEDGDELKVRVFDSDPLTEKEAKNAMLAKWPTRADAMLEVVRTLPEGLTTLDLRYATIPAGLIIPENCRVIR